MSPQERRGGAGGGRSGASRGGKPGGGKTGGGKPGAGRAAGQRGGSPFPGEGRGARSAGGGARRRPTPQQNVDVHDPEGVRLQKVLATAGLGSRRACEELIAAGRVTVDDAIVTELGVRVDPKRAVIHVDGLRVQLDTSIITIALNKPVGVVSTMHDPEGRPTIAQYVANREERLFHVGRLDADTSGIILLTNDGELANRLSHPSHGVAKTYLAQVEGRVIPSLGGKLTRGVELEDGVVKLDKFTVVQVTPQASLVEVTLHEGRNRIVRRLFDEVGHPVVSLVRTSIGPIRLGDLKPGRTRILSKTEVGSLMVQAGM